MQGTDRAMDRATGSEVFLLEEYKHLTESFLRNEELGERRFNFYMALVAAVLVSFTTIYKGSETDISTLMLASSTILLVFGVLTLVRLVRRDVVTDEYKQGINRIRRYFAQTNMEIMTYLYRNPYTPDEVHKREWGKFFSAGRGGLTRTMEWLNIVTAMILAGSLAQAIGESNWIAASVPNWLAPSVIAGLAALILQFVWVKWKYESAETRAGKPLIDILTSAEVRWFFEGSLSPEIDEWFSLGHSISKPESRADHYLVFPVSSSVGVKFRDGKLEIKPLVKVLVDSTYPQGIVGHAQMWEKWSYGDKDSKPLLVPLQEMLTKDTQRWITATKERRLWKISMDQDSVIEVDPESRPRNGCNVELTKIHVNDLLYWSFGFEAFGDPTRVEEYLDKVAKHVFADQRFPRKFSTGHPSGLLSTANSRSYPEWLTSLNTKKSER